MFKFIHARSASDIVDPSTTLGIEITVPEIAAACGLGNLDGQHGMPGTPKEWGGLAAISIALRDDVTRGLALSSMDHAFYQYTFATSRPDLDSFGAMAVLVLRSIGLADSIDNDLVRVIAERDSFRPSAEWSPSPLPTEANPWPRSGSVDSDPQTAHLGMICSPRRGDFSESWTLADRVFAIAWALTAKSAAYIDQSQLADWWALQAPIAAACGSVAGLDAVHWIAQAHGDVRMSRRALARAAYEPGAIEPRGSFVVVRVAHAGALGLGYCVAPVVVAFDRQNAGKVTIAAYGDGYLDAKGLTAELNRLEAKAGGTPQWGGPRNMCNSPQVSGGTRLSEDAICGEVRRFMMR